MSELTTSMKAENDKLTVTPAGRIDTSTSAEFEAEVKGALEGITRLVIDFSQTVYISSSGLRGLLSFHKIMKAKGGSLLIYKPSTMVYEVFEVTGFADMLDIER